MNELILLKVTNSKGCIACHYWYFNHKSKFQNWICNDCHDLTMSRLNLSGFAIITVKGVDSCCINYIRFKR